ncbi:MAG: RidA family protein [Anaerolineae bacterium]|jgi:2-iminobutanoate/2-iminopropanoate deaminase|nr:RidA family protein [Anaerolineae bacterium]
MKTGIATVHAPKALGPYSQGISTGQLIFTSGQLGLIPETGVLAGPDVESQARQVMKNIQAVLEAAGTDFAHVVKTTIFLTDMAHFKAVNAIYGEYFPDTPPARSTVAVAALPLGGLVEIETIALLP